MQAPLNILKTGLYTIGGEFINKKTYEPYQGYYYELNNRFFIGKEFNVNSIEIVKISSLPSNFLETKVLPNKIKENINTPNFSSLIFSQQQRVNVRYFVKNNNVQPILIKEVDKFTFKEIESNPVYTSLSLFYDPRIGFIERDVEKAEKIIPGITEFLSDLNSGFFNDIDNYEIGEG